MKIITRILSFFILYVCLPLYLTRLHCVSVKLLLAFSAANLLLALCCLKRNHSRIYQSQLKIQDLAEKVNILKDETSREIKNKIALQEKINRYHRLKEIIEKVNQSLDLDSIAESIASLAFFLIANNNGVCLLYLVDREGPAGLGLFKTKKENKELIIKSKEGDVFDLWVLKHTSPLLIEDIKRDFRFDLEKLTNDSARPFASLISAPLISEHAVLGILRLDHPESGFYAQEDLRFLVMICDLGAVALENGELFKRTQDLAIHDELTSLFTKGYFLERLKEECARSIRQNRGLALLMLDIDHFKNYNDKFGHTAGDIVLKTLSRNITEALQDLNPILSRFGGEEFCVVIPDINKKKACDVASQLRSKIEKTKIILRRQETNVTVSIGVAAFADDAKDEEGLIVKADQAMYQAKQKGRNRVASA